MKELKEEGLVKRIKNDQYMLSDRARSDIRYFPKEFRDRALFSLTNFENTQSHEKTLDELVKAFGVYTVHCFIEALKPTPSDDSKLSLYWVEDVLSPLKMYLSFLSTFRSGKHKTQRKPSPEFDHKSTEMLTSALKKKYPLQYARLLKTKSACLKVTHTEEEYDETK